MATTATPAAIDPADVSHVQFTSGTTGRPKEAEAAIGRGMALWEKLAEKQPRLPESRRGLADAYYNLGVLYGELMSEETVIAPRGRVEDARGTQLAAWTDGMLESKAARALYIAR